MDGSRVRTPGLPSTVRRPNSREKCLAPQGESSDEGAPVVQVTCNGSAFQWWDVVDHDDSIFQIRDVVTLKCMDVLGLNNNGNPVVQ
jgi:hypothetical protein